jgi:hypothetical protein
VIWHGRPDVGLRGPDVSAAVLACLVTFVALGTGLAAQNGWAWEAAARFAATYAVIVGVLTVIGRLAGAGLRLTLGTAFFAVVTAASFTTTQEGAALLCPLSCLCVTGTLVGMSFRRRVVTRYQLTRDKASVGETGRFLITFPVKGLPVVKDDLFGRSLGEVLFDEVESEITTRSGKVFRLPAKLQTFRRVRNPDRLLKALEQAQDPKNSKPSP